MQERNIQWYLEAFNRRAVDGWQAWVRAAETLVSGADSQGRDPLTLRRRIRAALEGAPRTVADGHILTFDATSIHSYVLIMI